MDRAVSIAGSGDWGDLGFSANLERLVDSCHETAALNPLGQKVLRSVAVRHLVNRLAQHAHLAQHPEIAERDLGAPIVITGLPRSGTTLLHQLLAVDHRHRVLRFWEALHPIPPDPARRESRAELVAQATRWLEGLYEMVPAFRSIHGATPTGPEECDALLQNEFASQHFDDMFNASDYSRWLATAPLAQEYASFAVQLRILTTPGGGRWVLKSPSHLGHLDALLAACPQATIVHCHRHPNEAVPSYASLILNLRRAYSNRTSAAVIGRQALTRCQVAVERALAVRRHHPDRFVDVAYGRLVRDPVPTVRELYKRIGRSLPGRTETAMRQWLTAHPQHQHGVHRYRSDAFGLHRDALSAAMGSYLEELAPVLSDRRVD